MIRIEDLHKLFLQHKGVSTDTRNIVPGSIFFCLKGANHDGNQYAQDALEAGAAFVVIDDPEFILVPNTILVDDALKCLQELAAYHRSCFDIPVLGITGTNGKTTTKELVNSVLSKKYVVIATKGNLNNHIGVPLTLLSISQDTEIAVIEMGANHPGEIAQLCEWARPNAGIITNIGKAHLEGFGSISQVRKTKLALYRSVAKSNGSVFINSAYKSLVKEAGSIHYIMYGPGEASSCRGRILKMDPCIHLKWGENPSFTTHTRLAGHWNRDNLLAAICIGLHFKVRPQAINAALEEYSPGNMRSQVRKTDQNTLIVDAYNANPGSMHKAIDYFSRIKQDDKVLILGDMLELGKFSDAEHLEILSKLEKLTFDKVFLVGKEFFRLNCLSRAKTFENTDKLKVYLKKNPIKGALILLKASRGIGLEALIETL